MKTKGPVYSKIFLIILVAFIINLPLNQIHQHLPLAQILQVAKQELLENLASMLSSSTPAIKNSHIFLLKWMN